ncbi:ribosome assembly RNA-binding protein YhbY [Massilibacterium senegalense]|uniref:ribosome assembly RNA-binding protein YhbY n=1 Tax=Massilibacterium senegalense TaxID=1632858 RepID=UPI0007851E64|nr:ribosome assembly RNA-binding protein YhbY [Massilibacterium senegalense]
MLTGKQKRYLRSMAHHLTPIFQIGKGGINDNLIKQLDDVLEARELIKISILQNCEEDKKIVAGEVAQKTNAELVQLIGMTIVLYRESVDKKQIELP